MDNERAGLILMLLFSYLLVVVSQTTNEDFEAFKSLTGSWLNTPSNWVGLDPCDGWDGIKCINSRVNSIRLPSLDMKGQVSQHIGLLSELETLDLSHNKGLTGSIPPEIGNLKKLSNLFLVGCGLSGPIPDEIGYLQELVFLSLNSNHFSGRIPPSIGNLSKLNWLDLTDNQLDGPIPVSSGNTPGLDMLLSTKHFHLGNNKLSGEIPPKLFSSEMSLIHVLFNGNQLTGSIPSTLGLVQNLEVVNFDSNLLNGFVPPNINNLTKVLELYLSNNKLSGPLPNLTGMNQLSYLDMSNCRFDASDFPSWLSTLQSLKTLKMENTGLEGQIPDSFFSLDKLQNVMLKDNKINGTLDIGNQYSQKLRRVDLQNNKIDYFKQQDGVVYHVDIILTNNPICEETGVTETYCSNKEPSPSNTTTKNCETVTCSSEQVPSPNCKCAYPCTGTLKFRTPSFSDWGPEDENYFEKHLLHYFQSCNLPVDSVSLSHPITYPFQYLLQVFPSNRDHFNRTEILSISFLLSNLTSEPFYFFPDYYGHYEEAVGSSKSSNIGIIIGAAVGGVSVLLVLLVLAAVYAFWQKKRAETAIRQSHPFGAGHGDQSDSNSSIPQLKGARRFSFEELQKYTKKFSEDNDIGCGGYGKVYRGTLPSGQLIAIKRAKKESMQGALQFKAEIELLSRVHHKNLVSLVGFCFAGGEQMLVYEYVPNGTLKDAISGKSGIRLDWNRRLKVALGVANGLAYLHDHASPRIIHRDIKSNNILLDEHLNAKVADFGLSKPIIDSEKDHVTTQVKGTMGYLDPEYYTSQQLTEKSDVYSYGVLMLELITARKPIERGKYIVKVVRKAIDKTKDLYGLDEILDPTIGSGSTVLKGLDKFVELAMKCLEESGADRPTMTDVVKEIEIMLQSDGFYCSADSAASNSSTTEANKWSSQHPYSSEPFDSSGALAHPSIEPK